MKKKLIITIVEILLLLVSIIFLRLNNMKEKKESSQEFTDYGELLISSTEGYNSIEVYKEDNVLVINAISESAFFDGAQYTVETQGKVKPEDIEIIWMTLSGGTERKEDDDFVIAEIKISEDNKLIADKKINFIKKAFDAIEDVLER